MRFIGEVIKQHSHCHYCGSEMPFPRRYGQKYCDGTCQALQQEVIQREALEQKDEELAAFAKRIYLLDNIKFEDGPIPGSPCWMWQASTAGAGYGLVVFDYVHYYAHRLSYVFAYGAIPEGWWLLHSCHREACINPAHLRPGKAKENAQDRVKAGHQYRGLPAETVSNIRGVVEPSPVILLPPPIDAPIQVKRRKL